MIDIENKVFNTVYDAVIAQYPSALVMSEYVEVPASFPCITVIEADNSTYRQSLDDSLTEHHVKVMYETNVYCAGEAKKSDAKAICSVVDSTMQNMRFTRTFMSQTPNIDRNVHRLTMRYEAVVESGATESGTTTYQIYRE